MKNENLNRTLWISGLIAGVAVGAYLYRNQDQYKPQQKKLKGLVEDLKKTATELGQKLLKAGQEQLEATKKLGQESVEATKAAGKHAAEAIQKSN